MVKRALSLVLVWFPLATFGQVISGGRISITLSDSATKFTGTGSSGDNTFEVQNNGARIDVGAGANDYFSSDGTTITTPGAFAATGGVTGALTGNASTATALAADPTDCSAGQYANAIAASGNLTCAAVAVGEVTGAAPLANPTLTGVPAAPTAAADTNTTQLATTAFVIGQATAATPIVDGTGAVGTSLRYARGDHVHPTDTSRAPVATPTFTGTASANGFVTTDLATPTNAAFSQADTGGTLLDSTTYYYRVTALNAAGETLASTETSQATSGTGGNQHTVTVNWGAITGATSYKVYGRSTGAELYMATVSAPTVTWVDDGSVTPSGALPTYGSSGNLVGTRIVLDQPTNVGNVIDAKTGGVSKFAASSSGAVTAASTIASGNGVFDAGYGSTHTVRGYPAAGSGTAALVTSQTTITTGKILDFSPDGGSTSVASVNGAGKLSMQATDSSGTPGAATINKPSGQSAIALGASSVVITNSTVTTASVVFAVFQASDATCTTILNVIPAAGSFTVNVNAACTAAAKIGWVVFN